MSMADRPVVEVFGFVFEILNDPHTGLPTLPQPCGSEHSFSMSVMLMGLSGQPSARAMASGIPNTTGVRVKDSGSPTSAGEAAAATRSVHTVEAGDHRVGHSSGLSLGQSSPAVRNRVASPDETLTGRTVAHSSSASASGDS